MYINNWLSRYINMLIELVHYSDTSNISRIFLLEVDDMSSFRIRSNIIQIIGFMLQRHILWRRKDVELVVYTSETLNFIIEVNLEEFELWLCQLWWTFTKI